MEFMSNSDDALDRDIVDAWFDADEFVFVSTSGTGNECRSHDSSIHMPPLDEYNRYQDSDCLKPLDSIEVQEYGESNEHDCILSVVPDQNENKFHMITNEAMNHESCSSIVTSGNSVCSERESSDGRSVSDNDERVHKHFDNLRYEIMENINVIVLGSKNAKNPPGITKEYRLFKSDKMKKRQTVCKETLQQLVYPQFIEYLRSKGKCADATSIDDLCFLQKEQSKSSYRRLLGNERDGAIIKDIQVNNTGRNKSRKAVATLKFEKFISNERDRLEHVQLEDDLDVKNLLNLMLDNMESIAPQSESTIKKFIQNYKRNYKWLITQSASKKRKSDNVHTLVKHPGDGDDDKEMCGKKRRECGPVSIGKTGTNGTTKVTPKSDGPCCGWNANLQLMPLPVDKPEFEVYKATDTSDVEDDAQSEMECDSVDNYDGFFCNDELWQLDDEK